MMTTASEDSADRQPAVEADEVKRTVASMLEGSGLEVRDLDRELVVTNPANPDAGQIHVAYMDGYVSWERVAWSYWGALEGFEAEGSSGKINAAEIIGALTPHPDVFIGLAHP